MNPRIVLPRSDLIMASSTLPSLTYCSRPSLVQLIPFDQHALYDFFADSLEIVTPGTHWQVSFSLY